MPRILSALVGTRLGACPFCMRTSFLVALAAWLVFALANLISFAESVALLPALALTMLWSTHLIAHGVRRVRRRSAYLAKMQAAPLDQRRRFVLQEFATYVAAAVVISTMPRVARAQGMNDCSDNDNYADERTGYGSCGQFCSTADGQQFDCPADTRPIFLKNGDCTCCAFPECS